MVKKIKTFRLFWVIYYFHVRRWSTGLIGSYLHQLKFVLSCRLCNIAKKNMRSVCTRKQNDILSTLFVYDGAKPRGKFRQSDHASRRAHKWCGRWSIVVTNPHYWGNVRGDREQRGFSKNRTTTTTRRRRRRRRRRIRRLTMLSRRVLVTCGIKHISTHCLPSIFSGLLVWRIVCFYF